ncbi:unnamed protein product [Phytophthora fragariaefolia]|uniref:Unnamed protein product n=1 Tax=Phytophthora fragariaefolia TaxID=1490495 RepID=A0A9W6YGW6_9STRA|nr:unnamed protein product [Phytophthora fragariaefolia]
MIAICDGHIYEQVDLQRVGDLDLCDTQPATQPGRTGVVSHLGDGSRAYPFRVGLTCLKQIRDYASIQA